LELKNDEKIAKTGEGLTQDEEDKLKDDFSSKAMKYGLYEAIPEAISNASFVGILTKPLSKFLTKSVVGKLLSKFGAIYGEELLTETITQMGQENIQIEAGLAQGTPNNWLSPSDWSDSFKQIAPQTFLLTTIMAGAGTSIIEGTEAIKKVKASLKSELGKKDVPKEQINKLVDLRILEEYKLSLFNEFLNNI
jgi:hypothetical protein